MIKDHSQQKQADKHKSKFGKMIFNDLRQGNFKRTLYQDLKDIYGFYLDADTRARLSSMGRFRRWLHVVFWLLKSLFLKLTPVRRVLVLVGLILTIREVNDQLGDLNIGLFVLLFVLALELKDKLLAREELEAGRKVQFALMPDRNPEVVGWGVWLFSRPANEVGGDLIDYIEINEKRLGVALGDVAGKGLGAALFMARLQAILSALVRTTSSLPELGAHLTSTFCRDCLPNFFASLVYLELTPESGLVRVLNAGHFPPIALQGDTLEEMPRGGPALGILQEPTYTEQCIELKPGDLMIVYSDGVTEARNVQGEFFGEQRFFKLLPKFQHFSCEEIGNCLLAEVDRFIGDAQPSDDLSLVLLKRMG